MITGFDVSFGQYIAIDHVFDKGHNTSQFWLIIKKLAAVYFQLQDPYDITELIHLQYLQLNHFFHSERFFLIVKKRHAIMLRINEELMKMRCKITELSFSCITEDYKSQDFWVLLPRSVIPCI